MKDLNQGVISLSRLSMIIWVNVVLNRTVVVDSDWRFQNLCGSHSQSQSQLYHVSWWSLTDVWSIYASEKMKNDPVHNNKPTIPKLSWVNNLIKDISEI